MLRGISKARIGVRDQERSDAPEPAPPGQPDTPVFLACDDVDGTWRELAGRGVAFPQEPIDMPFGRWALLHR